MKIYIACPKNCVTGGIELLHQLACELNRHKGVEAVMWYRGKNTVDPQPSRYNEYGNHYEITETPDKNSILLFPEIWAEDTNKPDYADYRKVIYWMSVDNYFTHAHKTRNEACNFQVELHLVQSEYARDFLINQVHVKPEMILCLTDYINQAYFANPECRNRLPKVLYNPAKGLNFTKQIIKALPDVEFKAIENMTMEKVIELMDSSMLYIDFGNHPGKDRMPREAAIRGCAIITSREGSAKFYQDVSIGDVYKIGCKPENIPLIVEQIKWVLETYPERFDDFKAYRDTITQEYGKFRAEVSELVQRLYKPRFSIIIPAYNAAGHIQKALESIEGQIFDDYELIVVCDSCADWTEQIAQSYGAITVKVDFHCDGPTRSKGLDIARGEYVLFMDDDDWWLHEYVLTQLDEKLKLEHEPDVLCFSFIFKGWKYATPKGWGGKRWIATWNKCWKRKAIGDTRFPNVKMASDSYFNKAMMEKPLRIVDWDMPMYYYNFMRQGSQTEISRRQA